MSVFKFARSDLTPIAAAALAFVLIGALAGIALAATAEPGFSLVTFVP